VFLSLCLESAADEEEKDEVEDAVAELYMMGLEKQGHLPEGKGFSLLGLRRQSVF
jgi:hypothetical protein